MLQGKVSRSLTIFFGAATLAAILGSVAQAQSGYRDPAMRIAHDMGYEDGSIVARQDLFHGKMFQPFPRGKFSHEDRGYRKEYGDKFAYEQAYASGYRQAYQRVFHNY